jgi:SIR2-like domain
MLKRHHPWFRHPPAQARGRHCWNDVNPTDDGLRLNTTTEGAVVILEAGATIGSGYTLCGQTLPGDRGFFGNPLVQERLSKYPALHAMLSFFRKVHGIDLVGVGLEEVWTFLDFSSRDLYRPLSDLANERNEWLHAIRKPQSTRDDDHYWTRFYPKHRTIPVPNEIDQKLNLLAGWDLRRLVSEIYGAVDAPGDRNIYDLLLTKYKILPDDTTTFISLNYDLVLEHALTHATAPWYYPHVSTTVDRDQRGIQIIKPHGSLNWLFEGNVPFVSITTDYRIGPVTHRCFAENRFKEAMIIPPTHLKQPVNIPETQALETQELLSKLWKTMAHALIDASRVFIIGYSFPSTDHHLRTLFYQVSHERRGKKYSEGHCCTRADGGQQEFVFGTAARVCAVEWFHPHERGFKDFVDT